jgi:hypothetical protein
MIFRTTRFSHGKFLIRQLNLAAFACVLVSATGCFESQMENANKTLFYLDYAKRGEAPGFRLEKAVLPASLYPGQRFYSATYDDRGRIAVLKRMVAPSCTQSTVVFTYGDKDGWPTQKESQGNAKCESSGG